MAVGDNTYGEVAGIQRLIGDIVLSRTFSGTTVPSTTQVENELDAAAFDLNRELDQAGYTVPVVNGDFPTAYGFLKAANEYGAAAVLLSTIPSEGYEPDEEIETPSVSRAQTYGNRFKSALKAIREHRIRATMRKGRLAYVFTGGQEDEDGNEKLPFFKRDTDANPGARSIVETE